MMFWRIRSMSQPIGTEQVLHLPHIYKVFGYILLFQLLRNLHDKMYEL